MINANSALFTDLTAEEGASISGGLQLLIKSIQCIKAGADIVGNDETRLRVDGNTFFSSDMGAGSRKEYPSDALLAIPVGYGSFVGLYDEDGWSSRDDFMGGFNITGTQGPTTINLSGSGSSYQITYAVVEPTNPF
jgi:hypothetical protein